MTGMRFNKLYLVKLKRIFEKEIILTSFLKWINRHDESIFKWLIKSGQVILSSEEVLPLY
jgi:hypothetical protein